MKSSITVLLTCGALAVIPTAAFARTGVSNITGPGSAEVCARAIEAANTAFKQATAAKHPNPADHASKVMVRVAYNDMGSVVTASDISTVNTHCKRQIVALVFAPALAAAGSAVVHAAPSPGVSGSTMTKAAGAAANTVLNPTPQK